jgi:hypothetical protein
MQRFTISINSVILRYLLPNRFQLCRDTLTSIVIIITLLRKATAQNVHVVQELNY